MVFTKSLLIKALGGVAGVAGTGVGVLAGTGVFNKKDPEVPSGEDETSQQDVGGSRAGTENLPPNTVSTASVKDVSLSNQGEGENGEASGNKEGSSVEEVSKSQLSNDQPTNSPNTQSPDETSTITSPSAIPGAGESQKQSTTDGADLGVGNLPSNPDSQQQPSEGQNSLNTLPSEDEGLENKSVGKTPEQEPKQPGTDSQDGQTGDSPQQGIQTSQDGQVGDGQQVNQDNDSDGSSVTPPTQGTEDNSLGGGGSVDSSRENATDNVQKGQGDRTVDSTEGHETLQPVSKDSQLGSSGSSNSSPAPGAPAGQTGGDSVDSTPPGTSGTPGSTPTNELGTEDDNGESGGGSESSDISTTDQATQSQSKEEKINAKLEKLGLPKDKCNFAKDETTKTCSISEKELNQMKFEGSDDSSDDEASGSETKNFQLKIEILTGNKKTAYGLNDDSEGDEDDSDVTKDLLFTLSGFDNAINVGHDSTTLYPNTNPEFKVENDELKLLWDQAVNLAKIAGFEPESQGSTNYSLKTGTTTLKYSLDGTEDSIKTLNSPSISGKIEIQGEQKDYNQGVKVELKAQLKGTEGDNSQEVTLDANTCYEIKYKDGDNGG